MRNLFFIFGFLVCSVSVFSQPAIADTTKVKLFDGANQWTSTMLAVKTYTGGGGGSTPVVIRPADITVDVNDYNPTDFGTATTVILNPDNLWQIKGFNAESDGETKDITNKSVTKALIIAGQHPDATASNSVDGLDYILGPRKTARIQYDATDDRWRVTSAEDLTGGKYLLYDVKMGSTTAADHGVLGQSVASGALGTVNPTATKPGGYSLGTAASATGSVGVFYTKTINSPISTNAAYMEMKAWVNIPTLSDATNAFTTDISINDINSNTTLLNNNSCGIRYTHSLNAGDWTCFCRDNAGGTTETDTNIAVVADTDVEWVISMNRDNTEARFFKDGVFVTRINTNMPADNTTVGPRVMILKSAGTTSRSIQLFNFTFRAMY